MDMSSNMLSVTSLHTATSAVAFCCLCMNLQLLHPVTDMRTDCGSTATSFLIAFVLQSFTLAVRQRNLIGMCHAQMRRETPQELQHKRSLEIVKAGCHVRVPQVECHVR